MDAGWLDLVEFLTHATDLTFRFVVGDVLDIVKILLSIAATIYFGRRYVKRHLRRLLEQQVKEIAAENEHDRAGIKSVTQSAVDKLAGIAPVQGPFDVKSAHGVAARYHAQRQTKHAIELLDHETILTENAAKHAELQMENARMKAATAQLQIGMMLSQQGETVEALAAFKRMLQLNPDDIDGLRFSGQELVKQGRLGEARETFERLEQIAIGQDESRLQAEALRFLALVSSTFTQRLALLEQSLNLEQAIHHNVGIAHTLKAIGDVRAGSGMWRIAEAAYDDALTIFEVIGHAQGYEETKDARSKMMAKRVAANNQTEGTLVA